MRVLYIITQADGGGAQKYVLALAKHFHGTIAAGDEARQLFDDATDAGISTIELSHLKRNINPWHDLLAVLEIKQLIKQLDPDIIHLNSTKAGILGSFASIGSKVKVVFTAHGFIFNEPLPFWLKNFYLACEKIASTYRDYIICVSEADRISALHHHLIAPEKIKTIHNGIPPLDFLSKDEARQKLNLPKGQLIVGAIAANDYPTKGLDVLRQASAMIATEGTTVVVIGNTAETLGRDAEINKFQRLGYISGSSKYLKAFDILNIPSRKEGLSFVALEALQAGLPIIATDVGGNKEALGNAGIIIEPGNSKKLSQANDYLLQNPEKRQELSEKAVKQASLFTEQKMLEATEQIYRQLQKTP